MMGNLQEKYLQPKSKFDIFIITLCFVSIILYLILSFVHFPSFYGIPLHNIPLWFLIGVGGIPLVFQIGYKFMKGNFGADILALTAIITATILGEYLAASIIILMLVSGQLLESFALRKASSVLLALAGRMPSLVHRKGAHGIEDIALEAVSIGDLVVVFPHETCPVDGIVLEGHSSMDESYLTGEPYQISKVPGVSVLSGAINGDSLLVIRAEKRPEDSRYAKIMEVMAESQQKRPHLRRLADQLGAVFTPIAFGLAFLAWYWTGDSIRFLAVLVIATPCPLLIAIPVALISAISMAAKRGIVIKDPTVLELMPLCRTAIFDKTGTLTYGQAELVHILPLGNFTADEVLQWAYTLENFSKHPLAAAIIKAATKAGLACAEVRQVTEVPGLGLKGKIGGKTVLITHRINFLAQNPEQAHLLPLTQPGLECLVLVNGKIAGILTFRDTLRSEGSSFIHHLTPIHHFKKVMMVSGDRSSEVDYLAKELDIKEAYSSQSPEQKVERVAQETRAAKTLFMGDGINDAPALMAATVGIAFGQNSITAEAGGAVILDRNLVKVDELLHISLRMRLIALQSALGGIVLSLIGMGFAAFGWISPVNGALLQEGIDVLAILNALRLTISPKSLADIREGS